MAVPTRTQARQWKSAYDLNNQESVLTAIADKLFGLAKSIPLTVDNLAWSGHSRGAAVGAAERQGGQVSQAASAVDGLRTTLESTGRTIGNLASTLTSDGDGLVTDGFSVSETWEVKDTYDYELMRLLAGAAAEDSTVSNQIDTMQTERANTAISETVRLQALATSLGEADTNGGRCAELGTLAEMTPVTAGIYPGSAREDAEAMARGTATTAQIARARAALGLTNEQVAVLNSGGGDHSHPPRSSHIPTRVLGFAEVGIARGPADVRRRPRPPRTERRSEGHPRRRTAGRNEPSVVGPGFQGGLTQSPPTPCANC